MDKAIHIGTISDELYAVATTVMLTSAKLHKHKENTYIVHILSNGLSSYSKRKLQELNAVDFQIKISDCNTSKYDGMEMPPGITASTMVKCELAELMPDVSKLLLLDGDMLVKKDLRALYDTDLTDKIVAATSDMVGMLDMNLHHVIGVERYFNAGLLLLNLELMRQENIGEQIINAKKNAPHTWKLGEQDPFNKVCDGRNISLPLSWNVEIALLRHWEHTIQDINAFYGTAYSHYTELEDDAGILHFCCFKPWKNKLMNYAPLWQKYHDISPYGDTSLSHDANYPTILKVKTTEVKLFGVIPFLSIGENELRKECILFRLLRLYKIKKRQQTQKFYLLGFLPIYSTSTKTREIK